MGDLDTAPVHLDARLASHPPSAADGWAKLRATVVAGGLSGMAVDLVLFPLDTVKTNLQVRPPSSSAATAAGSAPPLPPRARLTLRAMYRGLAPSVTGAFPACATFWVCYGAIKDRLTEATGGRWLPLVHASSAALANVAVVSVRNPFEVVKQQMQVGLHSSTPRGVATIYRLQGLRGFYAGYVGTLARELPFDAAQFLLYEDLKARYRRRWKDGGALVLWENCALGSVAGAFGAAVTTPVDVVKTRLMTQLHAKSGPGPGGRYAGVLDAAVRIVRDEGVAALFAGGVQRMAWIGMGGAVFLGTFEELHRRLS